MAQAGVRGEFGDVHPLRSTDPSDTDFSDLRPLGIEVGDARVVQLAELTHGAGDSFEARIRITKYLHERMGFDLILFETPLYLSRRMNRQLASDRPLSEVVDLAVFPIWAHSAEMQHLFRYVRDSRKGEDPIDLFGIDTQLISYDEEAGLITDEIRDVIDEDSDPVAGDIADRLADLVADLQAGSGVRFSPDRFLRARALLSDARFLVEAPSPEVRRASTPKQRAWAGRMIVTLGYLLEDRAIRALAPPFRGDPRAYGEHPAVHAGQNRRDQAMASNIAWFINEYFPGRKAVVWLANSHAQESVGSMHEGDDDYPAMRQHTTGSYLTGILGDDDVYTLLQSAYEGGYAGSFVRTRDHGYRWVEHRLEPAPDGSIEHALHEAGVVNAIVTLEDFWASGFTLRTALHDTGARPVASSAEGLLFLDVDNAATPRRNAPIQRESDAQGVRR